MATIALKAVAGNTAPQYQWVLERDDGSIIDLTGTTVTLKLFRGNTQTNITSGHDACSIVGAPTLGTIGWQPKTGDLPSPGKYLGDVYITYSDLTVEVMYNNVSLNTRKRLGS